MLPEDCVCTVLSHTSPRDACRSSAVSSYFRSAADSDAVWERFLPPDYQEIVGRAVNPVEFSSKKELYFRLSSEPLLIDGGEMSFCLHKSSGKKSYMLSAKQLSITWGNEPLCWTWRSLSDSRFPKVAELRSICWLGIQGSIRTKMLSPNTAYGAYLVMKITHRAHGLDSMPSETSVTVGDRATSGGAAYLCHHLESKREEMERLFYWNRTDMMRQRVGVDGSGGEGGKCERRVPRRREDGWVEVELGEFCSGEGDEEVKMSLTEVKGYQLKGGLIVEGIEVRVKC